jgi:hypothetical protein
VCHLPGAGTTRGDPNMPYLLESLDGKLKFSLGGSEEVYIIGRLADCEIRLDSRKVSRRHCCVAQVNDYLAVRDLGSTNGIRINGREVLEGQLRNGDLLTVGPYVFRVLWQPETAAAAAPPGPSPTTSPHAQPRKPAQPIAQPARPPQPSQPTVQPVSSANPSPQESPTAPQANKPKPKKTSLLEDSNLFKMLEADDPLLRGPK